MPYRQTTSPQIVSDLNGRTYENVWTIHWLENWQRENEDFFFFLNKAFAVDLPELCFLHLWGVEEQLVSMMDQLTKAFFPWLCVKWWKISYCKSNFPRNQSVYWIKARSLRRVTKQLGIGEWVHADRKPACFYQLPLTLWKVWNHRCSASSAIIDHSWKLKSLLWCLYPLWLENNPEM